MTVLNSTILESRRQKEIRETEKTALREALYSEIIWKLIEIGQSSRYGDLSLADNKSQLERALSSFKTCPVYDSAVNKPVIFYQIDDARGIEFFYRTILQLPTIWNSLLDGFEAFLKNPDSLLTETRLERMPFFGDFARLGTTIYHK